MILRPRQVAATLLCVDEYQVGLGLTDEEWGLLVGLPESVVVAASAAESDSGRRTAAESGAGQEAIANGRYSGNPLVEAVSTRLLELVGDPEDGVAPPVIEVPDPEATIAEVIDKARTASRLLAAKAEEADASAYRFWLGTIADEVVVAARSGGVMGIGGDLMTEHELEFRERLAAALDE